MKEKKTAGNNNTSGREEKKTEKKQNSNNNNDDARSPLKRGPPLILPVNPHGRRSSSLFPPSRLPADGWNFMEDEKAWGGRGCVDR